jgi:hypothetical protein
MAVTALAESPAAEAEADGEKSTSDWMENRLHWLLTYTSHNGRHRVRSHDDVVVDDGEGSCAPLLSSGSFPSSSSLLLPRAARMSDLVGGRLRDEDRTRPASRPPVPRLPRTALEEKSAAADADAAKTGRGL